MARRLPKEILTAKRQAETYCTKPGEHGFRVWIKTDIGWGILKDRLATRDDCRKYTEARLDLAEPEPIAQLPVPATVTFHFGPDGDWMI